MMGFYKKNNKILKTDYDVYDLFFILRNSQSIDHFSIVNFKDFLFKS